MSGRIERFEDFIAWQKARLLTARVYELTSSGSFAKDYSLRDHIRRSSISIMSNIAEGFERGKASEFHQFLSIAKGSCAELRSQLYIPLDAGYLDQETFRVVFAQADELGRVIGGLRVTAERRRDAHD